MRSRKIVYSLITIVFLSACSTPGKKPQQGTDDPIIGKWTGMSKGKSGSFIFYQDGRADIISQGRSAFEDIRGKGFILFEVDRTKFPNELDIVIYDNSKKEKGRIPMIFEILSGNKMRIRTFFTKKRPVEFDPGDNKNSITVYRE